MSSLQFVIYSNIPKWPWSLGDFGAAFQFIYKKHTYTAHFDWVIWNLDDTVEFDVKKLWFNDVNTHCVWHSFIEKLYNFATNHTFNINYCVAWTLYIVCVFLLNLRLSQLFLWTFKHFERDKVLEKPEFQKGLNDFFYFEQYELLNLKPFLWLFETSTDRRFDKWCWFCDITIL